MIDMVIINYLIRITIVINYIIILIDALIIIA